MGKSISIIAFDQHAATVTAAVLLPFGRGRLFVASATKPTHSIRDLYLELPLAASPAPPAAARML